MYDGLRTLAYVAAAWLIAYALARAAGLDKRLAWLRIGPGYLVLRSRRLNRLMSDVVARHRRAAATFCVVSAASGVAMIAAAFAMLAMNLVVYFTATPGGPPPAQLLLPGVTISFDTFARMLPGIVLILFSHEMSHKIALDAVGIRVRSVGVFLALLIPGAFVEPDEEEFGRSGPGPRMKVLAAGSLANIMLALALMPLVTSPGLFLAAISPLYSPPAGVVVSRIIPGTPMHNQSFIEAGDVILEVKGVRVRCIDDLLGIRLSPGEEVRVTYIDVDTGSVRSIVLRAAADPENASRGILGYIPENYYPPKLPWLPPTLPDAIYESLYWASFLSLNVALINMLPIFPLDGYGFADALLESAGLRGRVRRAVLYALMALSLALLATNLAANLIWRLVAG
ncbi:hypothetical protein B6U99_00020 [Candidatus Geothermarchaeota archaeon ex4572_27]|nr:MAG: hypothetical protein B6U99_00020 [Candidatus Geothermarchaeota archaeon ex4572_27]